MLNHKQRAEYLKERNVKVLKNMKFVSVVVAAVILLFGVVDFFIVEDKDIYMNLNQVRFGFLLFYVLPFTIYFFKSKEKISQLAMAANALGYGVFLWILSLIVGLNLQAVFHNTIGIFMLNLSLFIFLGLRREVALFISILLLAMVYVNFLKLGGVLNTDITGADIMLWFFITTVLGLMFNFYLERIQVLSFLAQWKLREVNETKYKLFSVVSHDMKNIISSQSTIADFLQSSYGHIDENEIKRMLGLLNKSANDAFHLFDDLIVWMKSQLDLIKPVYNNIEFKDFLNHQLEQFQFVSSSKKVTIDLSGVELDSIVSDATILSLVLRNILGNALKYSKENSTVSVKAHRHERNLHINITDYGLGMNPEQIAKAFSWDAIRSTKGVSGEKGSGMGLLLSKELLGYLKGNISIESRIDVGTSVYINVPEFDVRLS